MNVLGRHLIDPFDTFWDRFGPEIDVPVEYIEEAHSVVFGEQGADAMAPEVPAWASLPGPDLAYHVAHELTHLVLRRRDYPRPTTGPDYPPGSAEARVAGDLEEMVLHPALEAMLRPLGFTNETIQSRTLAGALRGVSESPVPERDTPWFFTWAIRYCELQLEQGEADWDRLRSIYEERIPAVCALGEELTGIMRAAGWGTREQALEAMVKARDAMGLGVDGRVLVLDPATGRVV